MRLVIDIPEELYKEYMSIELTRGNGKGITSTLLKAVKEGTPLPEHGYLIDIDTLKMKADKEKLKQILLKAEVK